MMAPAVSASLKKTCLCGSEDFSQVFSYDRPPDGEIRFTFSGGRDYFREVLRCTLCGHFISVHAMNDHELYKEDYVTSTYKEGGIRRAFDRINSLDPLHSDNVGRVALIMQFATRWFKWNECSKGRGTVLDIGSGICVFLYRMKQEGWQCTALDPDFRAAQHARDVVRINAICADFMNNPDLGRFNLVTLNKVLEHARSPLEMLTKVHCYIETGGLVYVELPDGEMAVHDGKGREEFFIDHHHIFSFASFAIMTKRADFMIAHMERLREPSGKYTLRAFLTPRQV